MAKGNNGQALREREEHGAEEGWALVYVERSHIHGKGLFAAEDIPADTLIGVYEGPRTRRDGRYVLWVEDGQGGVYGVRGQNHMRFLNHSRRPNAEFDGEELYALEDIPAGAEITFDYGEEWDDEEDELDLDGPRAALPRTQQVPVSR